MRLGGCEWSRALAVSVYKWGLWELSGLGHWQ